MLQTETGRTGTPGALRAVAIVLQALWMAAAAVICTLAHWHQRVRERQELAALDDQALDDLGLTRADVACECAKPFWVE